MATTLIGETRQAVISLRSRSGIPVVEETYYFRVVSDVKDESRAAVLLTPGLPILNESVSVEGFGICNGLQADRDATNAYWWLVTATFSSEVSEGQGPDGNNPSSDPTAWIPVYETKFERLQEVVTVDKSGNPVANSAGFEFPVGMTITRMIPIWEFYQIEPASVDDETIIDRNETVNDDEFKGRPEGTLLLTVNSSVIGFYYGQPRRLTQYAIRYNKENWKHKRLDVGEAYIGTDAFGSPVKKAYIVDNKLVMGPLDGSGGKSGSGQPAVLEFDKYEPISFSSFLRV